MDVKEAKRIAIGYASLTVAALTRALELEGPKDPERYAQALKDLDDDGSLAIIARRVGDEMVISVNVVDKHGNPGFGLKAEGPMPVEPGRAH